MRILLEIAFSPIIALLKIAICGLKATMISAVHGTGNVQSERKVVDMRDAIAYLEPKSNWVIMEVTL